MCVRADRKCPRLDRKWQQRAACVSPFSGKGHDVMICYLESEPARTTTHTRTLLLLCGGCATRGQQLLSDGLQYV